MAQINIIQNGGFDWGSEYWSGKDIEATHTEGAYLGNGSKNRVAEMDGNSRQTTVMHQSFKVGSAQDTSLTFRSALRAESMRSAGKEGFRVEILDEHGKAIAVKEFFPTPKGWTDHNMPVSFPSGGTYTLRLTELGPDNSLGAIVDDFTMLVCFASGTLIETSAGARPVEDLLPGDAVWTADNGPQSVLWTGRRRVSQAEQRRDPSLRPVAFAPGSLGDALPQRTLIVSQQHRMLVADWRAQVYFEQDAVLVPAIAMVDGDAVRVMPATAATTYVHFLLEGHQIVRANGALAESFFPSQDALAAVGAAARAELHRLFPDLTAITRRFSRTARPSLRVSDARVLCGLPGLESRLGH